MLQRLDCGRRLLKRGSVEEIEQVGECVIDPVAAALICRATRNKMGAKTAYRAKFSLPWLFAIGFG